MHAYNNSYSDDEKKEMRASEQEPDANTEATTPSADDGNAGEDEEMDYGQLQQRIAELEQEKDELSNRLMRLQADFDNYRKRSRTEKEEMTSYATSELLRRLLPVLDNLDRACHSAENSPEGIAEGVSMITRQLKELLESEGLKEIDCKGELFDPQCHEAVLRDDSGEYPPNTIVDEIQKGYMMKDRVIRPSMVKVAVEKSDQKADE